MDEDSKMKKLSRIYTGKEIICKSCKTKKFRVVVGNPKEKYGHIEVHKKNCRFFKRLLKEGVEL